MSGATTGAEYPIDTLLDMAAIPEEALPRFLAELPAILATQRALSGLLVGIPFESGGMTWVDDGECHRTVEIRAGVKVRASASTRDLSA